MFKSTISPPLEAGPSVLDAHRLPPLVDAALEYAARRLARKALRIDLVVVRRAYQLPAAVSVDTEAYVAGSDRSAPSRLASALRSLVRDRSEMSKAPKTPKTSMMPTPGTPSTATSGDSVGQSLPASPLSPTAFGIRYVYTDASLPRSHMRTAARVFGKAAARFALPPNWLGAPVQAAELGLAADTVARSATQNQLLFASEPLAVRALDLLYSFKAALDAMARARGADLEDAVDALRRLLLFRRRALAKRDLLRAYPLLDAFSETHLEQVSSMYRRAYGGDAIVADGLSASPFTPEADTDSDSDSDSDSNSDADTNSDTSPEPTPIAAAMDDRSLDAALARLGCTRPATATEPLPWPVYHRERRVRRHRPAGMVFVIPEAPIEEAVLSAASDASTFSTNSANSTSSLPSLASGLSSSTSSTFSLGDDASDSDDDPFAHEGPCLTVDDIVSPLGDDVVVAPDVYLDKKTPKSPPKTPKTQPKTPPTTVSVALYKHKPETNPPPNPPHNPPHNSKPRQPVLTLQTSFPDLHQTWVPDISRDDTAKPASCVRFFFGATAGSIGQVLDGRLASPVDLVSAGPGPRSYDDISPITRSEWGFLKGDLSARQVTVTTC